MPSNLWTNRNKLVFSAPGKVILHGEHSVVHGKRGIAMSLDLRTTLTLTPDNETITLDLPDVKIRECWSIRAVQRLYNMLGLNNKRTLKVTSEEYPLLSPENAQIIKDFLCISGDSESQRTHALLSFFHLYTQLLTEVQGFSVFVESKLPTGSGLGSSAAYASCLSGALLILSGRVKTDSFSPSAEYQVKENALQIASKWAFTSEVIMHGKPSGIDNSTCSLGGVNSFKSGDAESIGTCDLPIMLVNTRVPRSTKALLQIVSKKLAEHPQVVNPILDSMDAIAEKSLVILRHLTTVDSSPDHQFRSESTTSLYQELGQLIDMNQSLLSALGVSHPTLDSISRIAKEHGLHAKLTGAGGGGFALILLPRGRKPESFQQCNEALEALGCQVWRVELGVPGLTLH